jgi:hypothetical protein
VAQCSALRAGTPTNLDGLFAWTGIPHRLGDQHDLPLALWPRLRQGLERLCNLACLLLCDPVPVPDVPLRTASSTLPI